MKRVKEWLETYNNAIQIVVILSVMAISLILDFFEIINTSAVIVTLLMLFIIEISINYLKMADFEKINKEIKNLLEIKGGSLFEYSCFDIEEFIMLAKEEVIITGISCFDIQKYKHTIDDQLKNGVTFKFLMVDNEYFKTMIKFYYYSREKNQSSSTYEMFNGELERALCNLQKIRNFNKYYENNQIQVRLIDSIITTGFVARDIKDHGNGEIKAMFYQFDSESYTLPNVLYTKNSGWYRYFKEIIENQWDNAKEYFFN